jgi:hypothetical protein
MTSLTGERVFKEDAVDVADLLFEGVAVTVTAPESVLAEVLTDATRTNSDSYSLPEAEFILMAVVALRELLKIAPAPGNDLRALEEYAVRHCETATPDIVEAEWLDNIRRSA